MVRATRYVKDKEGNEVAKPTTRVIMTMDGLMHAEFTDRTLTLRPFGRRRGGTAEVEISFGRLYLRALREKIDADKAAKKAARKGRRK